MALFLLHHRHAPGECAVAYAAWKGFASPLRRRPTLSSCVEGGHEIWWRVTAEGAVEALGLLPPYVSARTQAIAARDVDIP